MKDQKRNGSPAASMAAVSRYLGLAFMIPIAAGGGWLVGSYLDKTFHTKYWTVTCLVLCVVGSFIQLLRELLRDANKQ